MKTYNIENIRKAARGEGGFTLIELLVTVTIIGILAAVVSVGVGGGSAAATTAANKGTFNQVQAAADSYLATSTANTLALTACLVGASANCDSSLAWFDAAGATATVTTSQQLITLTSLTSGGFLRTNASPTLKCVATAASTTTQIAIFACVR